MFIFWAIFFSLNIESRKYQILIFVCLRAVHSSMILSMPGSSKLNSTALTTSEKDCNVSEFTLNITAKNLLSSTIQVCTPEKRAPQFNDFVSAPFETNPNPSEMTPQTIKEPKTKAEPKKPSMGKRRSISDLVERYKDLLKKQDDLSKSMCTNDNISEETNLSS